MKVLMFGWEFPPFNKGGLGTACYGLSQGLTQNGVDITFVLPRGDPSVHPHLNLVITDDIYIENDKLDLKVVDALLSSYMNTKEYSSTRTRLLRRMKKGTSKKGGEVYGKNLFSEVERYSDQAKIIADFEDFDVIHAHDWMTYKAGIKAKQVSGKPLVVHVHATEFDRTGGNPNQAVYDIEREGMHAADKVIAVSHFTKRKIVEHYGIDEDKVSVVHNAVLKADDGPRPASSDKKKTVLFLGRLTMQKGPDHFIEVANRVIARDPNVRFVVAGTGDMEEHMVNRVAECGIARNVLFTGHLSGEQVNEAYQMADLYIMPSVSEPFGITPLESLKNNTPVMISKQSGVSEVLDNALKVDFWDIDEMVNKTLGVLRYQSLHDTLTEEGVNEVKRLSWNDSAQKCVEVYHEVLSPRY